MMHCAKFGRNDLADLKKKKKWNVYDDKNSDNFLSQYTRYDYSFPILNMDDNHLTFLIVILCTKNIYIRYISCDYHA